MSVEDVERLREGYEAFNAGDWDRVMERFAPEFRADERPDVLDSESGVGALDAMSKAGALFDDYRLDPLEFEDGGEWILVTVRQSGQGKASGVPVEEDLFHLWDVRDGQATQLRAFTTRAEALRAAGA